MSRTTVPNPSMELRMLPAYLSTELRTLLMSLSTDLRILLASLTGRTHPLQKGPGNASCRRLACDFFMHPQIIYRYLWPTHTKT